jgi:hypothetical protein
VLFGEEAKKAAEFILLADQTDTPLVFLQNTTGYMARASPNPATSPPRFRLPHRCRA